jgi:hypothetical protein
LGSGEVNDRKNRTEEEEERKKKKKGRRVGRPTSLVSAGGAMPCAAKGGIQEDPRRGYSLAHPSNSFS